MILGLSIVGPCIRGVPADLVWDPEARPIHLSRLTVSGRWVQPRVGPIFTGHSAADPLAGSKELASGLLARGAGKEVRLGPSVTDQAASSGAGCLSAGLAAFLSCCALVATKCRAVVGEVVEQFYDLDVKLLQLESICSLLFTTDNPPMHQP